VFFFLVIKLRNHCCQTIFKVLVLQEKLSSPAKSFWRNKHLSSFLPKLDTVASCPLVVAPLAIELLYVVTVFTLLIVNTVFLVLIMSVSSQLRLISGN